MLPRTSVTAPDAAAFAVAVLVAVMIWLRTRLTYAGRRLGPLRLRSAGAGYFGAMVALLVLGWFAAPALGRLARPGGADRLVLRAGWFLATYYLFILVHRVLQRRRIDVFGARAP